MPTFDLKPAIAAQVDVKLADAQRIQRTLAHQGTSHMTGKEQQADFAYKIGLWLRPILDVIQDPNGFDPASIRRRRAQFSQDFEKLADEIHRFCHQELGTHQSVEWHDIQGPLTKINNCVRECLGSNLSKLANVVETERLNLIAVIANVPVADEAGTFDAATPFSTYCKLKPMFCAAAHEVVYVDRYVDASLFFRYLRDVPAGVAVTVVRWSRSAPDAAFLDASRLFATERGPTKYRLLEEGTFHDRLLRIDGRTMLFGGSIRHAGHNSPFTLSTLPGDPATLQRVDSIVSVATELYGPAQTTHP